MPGYQASAALKPEILRFPSFTCSLAVFAEGREVRCISVTDGTVVGPTGACVVEFILLERERASVAFTIAREAMINLGRRVAYGKVCSTSCHAWNGGRLGRRDGLDGTLC